MLTHTITYYILLKAEVTLIYFFSLASFRGDTCNEIMQNCNYKLSYYERIKM